MLLCYYSLSKALLDKILTWDTSASIFYLGQWMTLDVWYTTSGIFCQFSFCSRNNYFRIISQSWIGHYFYSNIYGCAPRGVRRTFCFCTNIQPKLNKIWQNVLKLEKSIKKWLFCNGFSKFVQFGLNIGSKTHQVIDPLVLLVILTPLGVPP